MTIHDSMQIAPEFKRIFGLDLKKYLDNVSFLLGDAMIDIVKLDDYMIKTYPEYRQAYENDEMSLSDFITKQFGKKATELILQLLT